VNFPSAGPWASSRALTRCATLLPWSVTLTFEADSLTRGSGGLASCNPWIEPRTTPEFIGPTMPRTVGSEIPLACSVCAVWAVCWSSHTTSWTCVPFTPPALLKSLTASWIARSAPAPIDAWSPVKGPSAAIWTLSGLLAALPLVLPPPHAASPTLAMAARTRILDFAILVVDLLFLCRKPKFVRSLYTLGPRRATASRPPLTLSNSAREPAGRDGGPARPGPYPRRPPCCSSATTREASRRVSSREFLPLPAPRRAWAHRSSAPSPAGRGPRALRV